MENEINNCKNCGIEILDNNCYCQDCLKKSEKCPTCESYGMIEENGTFRIHPCVEINLRYNMGLVALKLAEKVGNTFNLFRILSVQQLQERNSENYLLLTEVHAETQVCAILTNEV